MALFKEMAFGYEGHSFPLFFRLPQELRDTIYESILVAQSPIELAPFWGERSFYHSFSLGKEWPPYTGGLWHRQRFMEEILPTLARLRTSKQINVKKTPRYSMPRSSASLGSLVMRDWLSLIGSRSQHLLRHIVVGYPGPTSISFPSGTFTSDYAIVIKFVQISLTPSPVPNSCPHPKFTFDIASNDQPTFDEANDIGAWMDSADLSKALSGLRGLLKLDLTISPVLGEPVFTSMLKHPFSSVDWKTLLPVPRSA
jgi:hypothetical protein